MAFDDDFPSMLAALEARMSREDIASALGVDEEKLDEIASGYIPDEEVADRLRSLAASPPPGRVLRVPTKAVVAFIVADALFFAVFAVVFFVAR